MARAGTSAAGIRRPRGGACRLGETVCEAVPTFAQEIRVPWEAAEPVALKAATSHPAQLQGARRSFGALGRLSKSKL